MFEQWVKQLTDSLLANLSGDSCALRFGHSYVYRQYLDIEMNFAGIGNYADTDSGIL